MFKLSKILPLLAIVAGFAGSAFTSAQEDAVEAAQTDYTYVHVDTMQEFTGTRSEAQDEFDCFEPDGDLCAEAEDPITGVRVPSQDIYRP